MLAWHLPQTVAELTSKHLTASPTSGNDDLSAVRIEITKFLDDCQTGVVEFVLEDALGKKHVFLEKVPVITPENLSATSKYPRSDWIACQIQERWTSTEHVNLIRVSTAKPWSIESTEGLCDFVVLASQVVDAAE